MCCCLVKQSNIFMYICHDDLLVALMTTEHVSVKSGKRCHACQANTGWRGRKRSVGLNSCNLHWPSQTRSFLLCPALALSPFPWNNLLPVQTLTRYPVTGFHLSFNFFSLRKWGETVCSLPVNVHYRQKRNRSLEKFSADNLSYWYNTSHDPGGTQDGVWGREVDRLPSLREREKEDVKR